MAESKPTRVLYMEDDEGLARLVQKNLEKAGYFVNIAVNGKDGISEYERTHYDIVLIDSNMPFLDGIGVARIITSKDKYTPMIMVTGYGNEKIAVEAMKLGVDDYIVKDVDGGYIKLLPSVIESAIEKRQLAREKLALEKEREKLILNLQDALAKIKTLRGLLPICASCKKIRDDKGYWNQIELYIEKHSEAEFTHGICPECIERLYPQLNKHGV